MKLTPIVIALVTLAVAGTITYYVFSIYLTVPSIVHCDRSEIRITLYPGVTIFEHFNIYNDANITIPVVIRIEGIPKGVNACIIRGYTLKIPHECKSEICIKIPRREVIPMTLIIKTTSELKPGQYTLKIIIEKVEQCR